MKSNTNPMRRRTPHGEILTRMQSLKLPLLLCLNYEDNADRVRVVVSRQILRTF